MNFKKYFANFTSENIKKEIKSFLYDLVIVLVIVTCVRTFLFLPFKINGSSMLSSYYDKELIVVDRLTYRFSEPNRGDVIVFKPNVSDTRLYYIKRVIGLPGDKLKIENGFVYIYSKEKNKYEILDEGYINSQGTTFVSSDRNSYEYTVPEGSYFVMGDNRSHSADSRTCFKSNCNGDGATNYIKESDIVGRVWIDLGYYNLKDKNFVHPKLATNTFPKFFSSPSKYNYKSIDTDERIAVAKKDI